MIKRVALLVACLIFSYQSESAGSIAATPPRPKATALPANKTLVKPIPQRPSPDYRDAQRYAKLSSKAAGETSATVAAKPLNLLALPHATAGSQSRVTPMLASNTGTGLRPWWTYEGLEVPGLGHALLNVGNLNLLVDVNDVDIPEGGLDLSFRRVYNSQSQHDATNSDGSTPSVFGNRWTSTLDSHLSAIASGIPNFDTVTVFTGDGAKDTYNCQINAAVVCTSQTVGIHDVLVT